MKTLAESTDVTNFMEPFCGIWPNIEKTPESDSEDSCVKSRSSNCTVGRPCLIHKCAKQHTADAN